MPLQKAEWGAMFAIIKDKFGIEWLLHYDETQTTVNLSKND